MLMSDLNRDWEEYDKKTEGTRGLPPTIYSDSTSTIQGVDAARIKSTSRTICPYARRIRDGILLDGEFELCHIEGQENPADLNKTQ